LYLLQRVKFCWLSRRGIGIELWHIRESPKATLIALVTCAGKQLLFMAAKLPSHRPPRQRLRSLIPWSGIKSQANPYRELKPLTIRFFVLDDVNHQLTRAYQDGAVAKKNSL
jgi:hypothetical protein